MKNKPSDMFYGASQNIFENAKKLRYKMTPSEEKLWAELSENKLKNYRFRRQHPLGNYIADFYCHKAKLVVEIDGEIHDSEENKEYDSGRDKTMESFGIKVLRFTNNDIEKNLIGVLKIILANLP